MTEEEMMEKGIKLLVLGIRVAIPKITDEEAENVICNVGNYIQLKRLKKEKK